MTKADLPIIPKGDRVPILRCSDGCEGEYSSTPGDYWLLNPDEPLVCMVCGSDMELVVKITRFRKWEP